MSRTAFHGPRNRPLDVSALVVGLVCLGLAGSWALGAAGVVPPGAISWLLPLLLVLAGTAGILAALLRGRRTSSVPDPPHEPTHEEEYG